MKTIYVMAPLMVGDPQGRRRKQQAKSQRKIKKCKGSHKAGFEASAQEPEIWRCDFGSPAEHPAAWREFDAHLAYAKSQGVHAVSTDIWWGLVEQSDGQYGWDYYDELSDHIIAAGLCWVPIMSFHKCGTNVGDSVRIDLPEWIWAKLAQLIGSQDYNDFKYVSEQGNASDEAISCWAVDLVLETYKSFFNAFQIHFASKACHIAEIIVGLGPASELRFPSYNRHDWNTDYPNRGALQCYSRLARQAFEKYILYKYGDLDSVRAAWGSLEFIEPPRNVDAFFFSGEHISTQYGRDFFDFYCDSLMSMRKVLIAAIELFSGEGAAFAGIDIGAKVPGVHWRIGHVEGEQIVFSDRLAELTAGMLRTSEWGYPDIANGYRHIVTLFKELQQVKPGTNVVLHFTCLEMLDGACESLARQLVRWVGGEAARQGVVVRGENALCTTLEQSESWNCMSAAIGLHPPDNANDGHYSGLTILRITHIQSGAARREFENMMRSLAAANGSLLYEGSRCCSSKIAKRKRRRSTPAYSRKQRSVDRASPSTKPN